LVLPLLMVMVSLAVSGRAQAAAKPIGYFRGDAYGSYAFSNVGILQNTLGRTAWIVCACQGTSGNTLTNQVNSLSAGSLVNTGVMKSTTWTKKKDDGTGDAKSTSTVAGLNV